jgi:hypothetical protein
MIFSIFPSFEEVNKSLHTGRAALIPPDHDLILEPEIDIL